MLAYKSIKKQMTPFPHNNFKRREKWMITLAKLGLVKALQCC